MKPTTQVSLLKSGWVKRVLEVTTPEGAFLVEYNGRGMGYETVSVNGERVARSSAQALSKRFEFDLGSRRAAIEVTLSICLTVRALHLIVGEEVVYCDRRRRWQHAPALLGEDFDSFQSDLSTQEPTACPACRRQLRSLAAPLPTPTDIPPECLPLGELTAEFATSGHSAVLRLVGGLLATVIGVGLLVGPWVWDEFQRAGPTACMHAQVVGGVLAAAGLFLCASAFRLRGTRVLLGPRGLGLISAGQVETCLWDEVHVVRETVVASGGDNRPLILAWAKGEDHVVTLACADGRQLVLKNCVRNFPALVRLVQQHTLERLLPPELVRADAGEPLSFGRITIDPAGVRHGDARLNWDEVEAFQVEGGFVTVRQRGKWLAWLSVPVGEIPNAHVLAAVAKRFTGR
jgi:hypothetical protein